MVKESGFIPISLYFSIMGEIQHSCHGSGVLPEYIQHPGFSPDIE